MNSYLFLFEMMTSEPDVLSPINIFLFLETYFKSPTLSPIKIIFHKVYSD